MHNTPNLKPYSYSTVLKEVGGNGQVGDAFKPDCDAYGHRS